MPTCYQAGVRAWAYHCLLFFLSSFLSVLPPPASLQPSLPPSIPPARGLTAGAKNERVEGEREEGGPE